MKKMFAPALSGLVLSGIAMALNVAPAEAGLLHNQNVNPDVIFGSGNANGGFTVNDNRDEVNIELGLRAKLRFDDNNQPQNIFNSNGDGTFDFAAGLPPTGFSFAPGSTSTAIWNFEWTINSASVTGSRTLSSLLYLLEIDFDPGAGTDFLAFDPIFSACADHAFGNNTTGNGGGTVADCSNNASYPGLLDNSNVAQNSWNMEFFDGGIFPFDGRDGGAYTFRLSAFLPGNKSPLAVTEITVNSIAVPEPAALGLMAFGLIGLGVATRRRKNR